MWAYHPWDSYVQKNNTLKNIKNKYKKVLTLLR
jgi:hypothetical protein